MGCREQRWIVNSLIDPEGRSYRLGEILADGIPVDLPLVKSGNRYGYPPLRDLIIASQRYDVSRDNVLVTLGTQLSNFLALSALLEPGDHAIIDAPSWDSPGSSAKRSRRLLVDPAAPGAELGDRPG